MSVPVLKSAISQKALVPVRREQYLETRIWELGVLKLLQYHRLPLSSLCFLIWSASLHATYLLLLLLLPIPILLHYTQTPSLLTLLLWYPMSSHCCPTIWSLTIDWSQLWLFFFQIKVWMNNGREESNKAFPVIFSFLFWWITFVCVSFLIVLSSLNCNRNLSSIAF